MKAISGVPHYSRACVFLILQLLFIVVLGAIGSSQEAGNSANGVTPLPTPAPAGYGLADLQRLAQQNNPTLRQAAAAADMARGLYRQAGLYPNPQVGYLRTDSETGGQSRSSGVFVGQEIVTADKLQKAQETEAWEIQQANWNYQAQLKRVNNDVELRYWDALAAQQLLLLATNIEQISVTGFQASEKLFTAREAPKMDLLQARIQLRTAQLSKREAQARWEAALKQLATVTGCPEQRPFVTGNLEGPITPLEWESSLQYLLASSPQVQAAKARAQHFQKQYRLEQANAVPNMNLQVVAERDHYNQYSSVSTLISMPIPFVNRNQGNIARAAAETHESVAEVQRTELALRDQMVEVFRRYDTAKNQVEELKTRILPDAAENLDQTNKAYKAAEIGYLNVVAAQKTFLETNQAYLEAWLELRKSTVEITGMLLTGALNPAEVGTALQSNASSQRRGVLNQIHESSRSNLLPATLQTGSGP